jgi:hypothetical protein
MSLLKKAERIIEDASAVKLCKNCKWFRRELLTVRLAKCGHPENGKKKYLYGARPTDFDTLVGGSSRENTFCSIEREFGMCGPEGAFFEKPKNIWQRWRTWFFAWLFVAALCPPAFAKNKDIRVPRVETAFYIEKKGVWGSMEPRWYFTAVEKETGDIHTSYSLTPVQKGMKICTYKSWEFDVWVYSPCTTEKK